MDEDEIEKLFEKALAKAGSLEEVAINYVFPTPKGYPKYNARAMIDKCEKLGRPLTEEESKEFIIGYH